MAFGSPAVLVGAEAFTEGKAEEIAGFNADAKNWAKWGVTETGGAGGGVGEGLLPPVRTASRSWDNGAAATCEGAALFTTSG